jgi:predicted transcriptional regulator
MMPEIGNFTEQGVMGWGNRGWIEIIDMILESCGNGALKTHIMYECNLNSKQISKYIQFLKNRKLIESLRNTPSKRTIFRTTEMGKKYMDAYKQLENIFK